MAGLLQKEGHVLTTDRAEAEIIVVNTCSFIQDSKQESIDTILEAAGLKKSGACKRLIVTGCLAERYPQEIRSDLPEVDTILGTNQVLEITRAVAGETSALHARSAAATLTFTSMTKRRRARSPRPPYAAYIKIAEGCDHTCAFCIIPSIRGPFRSRSIASLVQEARNLAHRA